MITAIRSKADYDAALIEIEKLIEQNVPPGTADGDRLNILTLLVRDYEEKQIEKREVDPIEAIKFRMAQMRLTPRDLVPLIGSRSKVSEIISRKRPLSLAMVRALHKGLGIPAQALLQDELPLGSNEETPMEWSRFPVREMASRGWFKGVSGKDAKETIQHFLLPLEKYGVPLVLYKQGQHIRSARQMDMYALAAWRARVCLRALEKPPEAAFDPTVLSLDFMRELSHLSTLDNGPRYIVEYLDKIGISFIVEPHLPETYIDGAAILLTPMHPVVALTLRYDRIDNFWFVLMHELVHVARHLSSEIAIFYDDLDVEDPTSEKEREADHVAGEALIPEQEWKLSPASNLRTPDAVNHLASRLRIHPAIVAGRIRHHFKSYRVLNRLVGQGQVRRLFPEFVRLGGQ